MFNTYYYYSLLLVFVVICFMMSVDKNVSAYIDLVFKLVKLNIQKWIWMIRFHPKNPITNFLAMRKYMKIAKDLEKEFNRPPS